MLSKSNKDKDSLTGHKDHDIPPDASHLLVERQSHVFTKFVGRFNLKPRDQQRMSLGHFTVAHPAKGFSIALNPEPKTPDTVVTHITPLGTAKRYELVLHVANFSDELLNVEVWGM